MPSVVFTTLAFTENRFAEDYVFRPSLPDGTTESAENTEKARMGDNGEK